ncbi:hypothetical protein Q5424_09835 [Conexibacter sp. JD483]|uniref:hypothetical protein n=1 Tax=unclassified Conexibacter TaxID=2627773 RepID=UPI00271C49AF|nr:MULTISPECIES: hypothetical protein [unclassified Conexibacter]MDO8185405.1 hypothetical protein [Conexibacter sp. CPCC 205706]MDO8198419.1 hypothetical protein [Conexibacter sp. CPCC 205762]MDR9369381.1 hypothetical protein [Conexibacter sp. JD483]
MEAAQIDDLAERTLEVVAIIDAAVSPLGIHPVVVGGMAVYFWTEDPAFVTYDIDVVMATPDQLSTTLAVLGFEKNKDGRHWSLPGTGIFLEAPSVDLDADAVVKKVSLPSGRVARVLSPIDILLDRLAEFQATGHQLVAQQALVLLSHVTPEGTDNLRVRAKTRRVAHALDALSQLATELAAGREPAESDELHQIARLALRAEYTFKQP